MLRVSAAAVLIALSTASANAQIKVGLTLSANGPAAALGIPERNTVPMMPETIAGNKVEYITLEDGSDTTNARRNVEKLINEHKVDVIIGASTTPTTLSFTDFAAASKTPVISLGAGLVLVRPMNDVKKWTFQTPFNDEIVMGALSKHMQESGVKTLAIIAFNDALGESGSKEMSKVAETRGLKVVAVEKFNPTDTSVTAQVLKVMAQKPDAVVIIASGSPSALPQITLRERGFKSPIYQNNGVVTNDFIRVGGKHVEGTLVAAGPVIVADDLPDNHPVKAVGRAYKAKYEERYGRGTFAAFGGNAWDAILLVEAATPEALKKGKPGTPEFRSALRDAIENVTGLAATHGIINMTAGDHNGFSVESPVMITIKDGKWVPLR